MHALQNRHYHSEEVSLGPVVHGDCQVFQQLKQALLSVVHVHLVIRTEPGPRCIRSHCNNSAYAMCTFLSGPVSQLVAGALWHR